MDTLTAIPKKTSPAGDHRDDERRLEEMMRTHGAAVRAAVARRYASALGSADVDDVVAIASHRLWKYRAKLAGVESPRAWYLRIADNVARDVLRYGWQKARQLEVRTEREWLESLAQPMEVTPVPNEGRCDLTKALREIVATLPEVQRQIVWADALHSNGPVPSDALARELEIPQGTVRVYRKRALEKIRREIEKRGLTPN